MSGSPGHARSSPSRTPAAALERAMAEPGPVVVAGSLYLVGEVRGALVDDPALRDPDRRPRTHDRDRAPEPSRAFADRPRHVPLGRADVRDGDPQRDARLVLRGRPADRDRGRRRRRSGRPRPDRDRRRDGPPDGRGGRGHPRRRGRVDPAGPRTGRPRRGTASGRAGHRGPARGAPRHTAQHRHHQAGRGRGRARRRRRPGQRRVGRGRRRHPRPARRRSRRPAGRHAQPGGGALHDASSPS